MPWRQRRSWSTDLDALTRLHKALLALDVGPDAQHEPVPALAEPVPAPALPTPSAGLAAPQELVPPQVKTEQQTLPELAPGPGLVPDPAAANPHQTGRPSAAMPREAALYEEAPGGQMMGQRRTPESESAQTMPFEAGHGEQEPDQKDAEIGRAHV